MTKLVGGLCKEKSCPINACVQEYNKGEGSMCVVEECNWPDNAFTFCRSLWILPSQVSLRYALVVVMLSVWLIVEHVMSSHGGEKPMM